MALGSPRATEVSVYVVRAFVRLREQRFPLMPPARSRTRSNRDQPRRVQIPSARRAFVVAGSISPDAI